MKFDTIESADIADQQTAINVHAKLRGGRCTPAELGRFYADILKRCLWPSQAELAKGLGTSTSMVSRAISINRIPDEIASLVGGPEKMTFRLAKCIDDVIEELGIEAVVLNAANLRPNRSRSTRDLLAALAMGREPPRSGQLIRLSLDKSNRFIRIESPYIKDIAENLTVLEDLLNGFAKLAVPTIYAPGKIPDGSRPAAQTHRVNAITQHSKLKGNATPADLSIELNM